MTESSAGTPTHIGGYKILRLLGEGGQGVVYEAEQDSPQRRVALKVVRGGGFADPDRLRMFQREADTLARLQHPGIATIHELGATEGGDPFFAMELVNGPTLAAWLQERPATIDHAELRLRLGLFHRLVETVHYAHQRGVIHRDLKPGNIIIALDIQRRDASSSRTHPEVPELKVLDFGLARITDTDVNTASLSTEVGVIKGTLSYMSPEQSRGDPSSIDLRSDVYSLGVILYEMLSGRRPIDVAGCGIGEALRLIAEEPAYPLRQVWSGKGRLDRDVQTIVHKALEKESVDRYSSCAGLAEDVSRYLDSRPILARPPSALYQLARLARRHRALFGGLATAALALVIATVVSTVFGFREATQRKLADALVEDLESVAGFQAEMISEMDPQQVGVGLLRDLRQRVQTRAAARGEDSAIAIAAFDEALREINMTDVALDVIDRGILEPASGTIEDRFGTRPLIAAQLWETIGVSYRELGMSDRAADPLQRAAGLFESSNGAESRSTLTANRHLAAVLDDQKRFEDAEELYLKTRTAMESALGPRDPDTLRLAYDLAVLYDQAERYDEAVSLHEHVLELADGGSPEHEPLRVQARIGLGDVRYHEGQHAGAREHYAESLPRARRVFGNEDKVTVNLMTNLAVVLRNLGEVAEAEELYLEAIAIQQRTIGEEHPDTLRAMNNLAFLWQTQGRLDEAHETMSRVVEVAGESLGPRHLHTGVFVHTLAEVEMGMERWEEASAHLDRARWVYEVAESAPFLPSALIQSAQVAARLGQGDRVVDFLRDAFRSGWADLGVFEDEVFDEFREDQEFDDLLMRLKDGGN